MEAVTMVILQRVGIQKKTILFSERKRKREGGGEIENASALLCNPVITNTFALTWEIFLEICLCIAFVLQI